MVRSAKRKISEGASASTAKKGRASNTSNSKPRCPQQLDDDDDDFFKQLLRSVGFTFKNGSVAMDEDVDQATLQKKILVALKTHTNYQQILDEFIEGFDSFVVETDSFISCLLPTSKARTDITLGTLSNQDSLVKLLLGINALQPKVITCLLEKLPVLSEDDGTLKPHFQGQEIDLPRLIINQFRWLDRIVDGKGLVEKMFEVIPVAELPVKREIIACMPEVVDDSKHADLAQRLKESFLHISQLTTAVIDAFSNLNLRGTVLTEVRQAVLEILDSANLEDFPMAVRFILQSVTDDDCVQVIRELRLRLNFGKEEHFGEPNFTSTMRERRESNIEHELLTLDVIRLALRFQKCVASGWLKVVESIRDPTDNKITDIYSLMVLHGVSTRKKSVEAMFRQKIKSDVFTGEVVERAFASHWQAFAELYKDVLSIAECLLRSPEISISSYGAKIYKNAFAHFDTYCQQEVIAALITHIGSGLQMEIESSFDVLSSLVILYPKKMAPFTIFLKGILDYLDSLSVSQIRCLFSMLSTMMVQESNAETVFEDDMYILIRKHLSYSSIKYRRIGIIGSVMIAANMSKSSATKGDESMDFSSSQAVKALQSGVLKEVINLLEMAKTCICKDAEAAALFYDELSSIVATGDLDKRIVHWIAESVVACFQDEFLVDADTIKGQNNIELAYDLDEAEEGGIAVNLFPLLLNAQITDQQGCSSSSSSSKASNVIYMNPLFRLLSTCERVQHQGNLEGIDALLGCPLILFKLDAVDKLDTLSSSDKELMCNALFFSINWLREIVNAFSTQEDPETKGKILSRLETISVLGNMLERCLQDLPSYSPPHAIFDSEPVIFKPPQSQSDANSKKKTKRKTNQKDAAETTNVVSPDKEPDVDKDSTLEDKTEDKGKVTISWLQYRCFFREFDLAVFKVLQYGVVSKNILDTDMNTKETEVLSLKSSSLNLLLEDLESKAAYVLPSTIAVRKSLLKRNPSKDIGFSNLSKIPPKKVAEIMIRLMPSLCDHLESINSHFQCLLEKSDCIIDGDDSDGQENQIMSSNFQLILSCLNKLFTWEKLKRLSSKSLLKKSLANIAGRIKPIEEADSRLPLLLKEASHYFEELSLNVRDLATAVLILKILTAFQRFDDSDETRKTVSKITKQFLKKEWSNDHGLSGQKFNDSLQYLIKLRTDMAEKPVAVMEELAGFLSDFVEDKSRHASLPTLHKNTFAIFYKTILEELTNVIKADITDNNNNNNNNNNNDNNTGKDMSEVLDVASCSVRTFYLLIGMVKTIDTRSVLGSALKSGRMFLEAFLKYYMPILDTTLKTNKDEVHSILKNLQQSTRCLQHFCGHSKVAQDMTLTNYVPSVKKCLETFVFRVKAMLAANRCHSAFWLGNLKNRDIHGNEIQSQISVIENDDDTEADSEQVTQTGQDVDEDDQAKELDDESYSESF